MMLANLASKQHCTAWGLLRQKDPGKQLQSPSQVLLVQTI